MVGKHEIIKIDSLWLNGKNVEVRHHKLSPRQKRACFGKEMTRMRIYQIEEYLYTWALLFYTCQLLDIAYCLVGGDYFISILVYFVRFIDARIIYTRTINLFCCYNRWDEN